ncbi:hypothetical protein EJ05DRAFT_476210 [Pseudovirgaria hyperparasitica]|uniref:Secreted protein n=1 Tax=Pseudovirgaria hyperparasitica TaxID=470096 RepID=A0A6A6W7I9_9PEZI|nr:uncharacterized protein EJ05DRAFT_476210 [Pseudovirgaria hyperparasitica]KAF2757920.1 hypothetical protein EJ05DRAFT_476210 [Pseudovirgaria hyperparasitica]
MVVVLMLLMLMSMLILSLWRNYRGVLCRMIAMLCCYVMLPCPSAHRTTFVILAPMEKMNKLGFFVMEAWRGRRGVAREAYVDDERESRRGVVLVVVRR